MLKSKVLVVDGSVTVRKRIGDAVKRAQNLNLAGVAQTPSIALQKIGIDRPDVVALDSEMQGEDVIDLVRKMVKLSPSTRIIVFGRKVRRGSALVLDLISAGVTDWVAKPQSDVVSDAEWGVVESELLPKLSVPGLEAGDEGEAAEKLEVGSRTVGEFISALSKPRNREKAGKFRGSHELLCVGSSTGGPNALAELFGAFSKSFPVPVLITQHMPAMFTEMLAKRLNGLDTLRFFEAEEGMLAQIGCAYIAPGGKHMTVSRTDNGFELHLNEDPPENSCRPAVDVMLRSVARSVGGAALVTILTGMGKDGFLGCEQLSDMGATVIAQDEESSVVWGMPGFVAMEGIADKVLPLHEIAESIHSAFDCNISHRTTLAQEPLI